MATENLTQRAAEKRLEKLLLEIAERQTEVENLKAIIEKRREEDKNRCIKKIQISIGDLKRLNKLSEKEIGEMLDLYEKQLAKAPYKREENVKNEEY